MFNQNEWESIVEIMLTILLYSCLYSSLKAFIVTYILIAVYSTLVDFTVIS